jgi:hypothetical protein
MEIALASRLFDQLPACDEPLGQSPKLRQAGNWSNRQMPRQVLHVLTGSFLKSGHFATSSFKRFADAAEAGGSNIGLTVKTRYIRVIREPISSVWRRGIHGFPKVSRHQGSFR